MLLRKMTSRVVAAAVALIAVASGCSLTREKSECASTTECREAFGPGFTCTEEGWCGQADPLAACHDQNPADLLLNPEKYKNYVVLGSLLRRTGKEGARQDASVLALEAVNRFIKNNEEDYPSLDGLRFAMVQCDHEGDTEEIAELARYLTDTLEVKAILGPASSSGTTAAFLETNIDEDGEERRRVLFVSPSATSSGLTDLEDKKPGLLWRTAPVDDVQGALMGSYAEQIGEKFAVLYENTSYGRGLYDELLVTSGSLCDACGISFDAETSDRVPLALALASNAAQKAMDGAATIFFIGAQESHIREMMRRLKTSEFEGKKIFFSDAAASADTVSAVPDGHHEQVLGSRASSPQDSEALRFFTGAYEGRYDESPLIHSFTANAYDAAWLTLLGVLQTYIRDEPLSAENIAAGFGRISDSDWAKRDEDDCPMDLVDDECPPITLDASHLALMLDTLTEDGEIDVQGASGNLNYCKENEELERSPETFELWHIEPDQSGEGYILVPDPGLGQPDDLPPCLE